MNVISKFCDNLPSHWKIWVQKKSGFKLGQFAYTVWICFEDRSTCVFNYAFMVEDKKREEIAVFTEHCGYHIYSTRGLERFHQLKHEIHTKVRLP